jgi:hypothetical protein
VNECHGTFGGCITRVTRLHADGTPIVAATASAISAGWSEISMEPDVSETDNWRQRLPSGMYVTHAEDRAQVEAVGLTMEFIQAEPALFELLGGGTAVVDWAGNIVGIAPTYRQATPVYVAVEVWAETPTAGKWSYWLLPFVSNAVFGAATFTDDVMTFAVTAKSGQNARWGVGPFNVVPINAAGAPGPLTMPLDATMTLYERTTTIPPPTAVCAYTPFGAWLTPAVGTITTPDPGPLPNECTFVYQRRGRLNETGNACVAGQFDLPGQRSWRLDEPGLGSSFTTVSDGDFGGVTTTTTGRAGSTTQDRRYAVAVTLNDAGTRRMTVWEHNGHAFVQGATVTAASAATFDSAAGVVRLGAWDASQVQRYDGRIYSVELRTGLDPDARYLSPAIGTVTTPDPHPALPDVTITGRVRKADVPSSGYLFGSGGLDFWLYDGYLMIAWLNPAGARIGDYLLDQASWDALVTPGEDFWIGATIDLDDGLGHCVPTAITSADGVTWTPVPGGPPAWALRTPAITHIGDSATVLRVGQDYALTGWEWKNRIYTMELRTGLDPNAGAARYLMPHSVVVSPDAPDLAIGSERVRLTLRIWVDTFSSAFPAILGKQGAEGREYLVYGYAGGVINGSVGSLTAPGNSDFSFYASVPLGVPLTMAAEFQTGSNRITVTLDNGSSYTTDLPVAAHIFNSSAEVYIGALDGSSSFRVYWAQLERLDAGGNATDLVWRFDANEAPTDATTTTWTDPRGRMWSVNDPKYISGRTIWRFDAADAPTDATTTTWTDPRGRTWTVTNPAAVAGRTLWRFDAEDYPGTGTVYVDPRGRTWTLTDPAAIATEYLT